MHNIPNFPAFTTLSHEHQDFISGLLKDIDHYSDFNFISLWVWDHQDKLKLSLLNDNLVVLFQDYVNSSEQFYSLLGQTKIDESLKELLAHSSKELGINEVRLIPEFVVNHIQNPNDFVVTEDRDNFDYIIAIPNMANLDSKLNETKRHMLNQFIKNYGHELRVSELDLTDPKISEQLLAVFEEWAMSVATDQKETDNERNAIKKLLTNHHKLASPKLHIVGMYMGGDLKAFSINELANSNLAVGHFKKASRDYKGLGVALDSYTAKSLASKNISHINVEQDLGIEGLRKSKMHMHPEKFLKKFTVKLR